MNNIALVVCHNTNTSNGSTCDDNIACSQCTVLYKQSCDRSSSLVKTCFDNSTLCQSVGVSLKLGNLGKKKYVFKQLVNAHTGLCGYRNADNVAAPFLYNKVMLGELLLDIVRVCAFLIHLVDSNDDGNARSLCVVDSLNCLGHDTVISGNNEDSDIRYGRTSCTHGGKCLMAGSIKECDVLALVIYSVSTDVLCDTARLGVGNVGVSDPVEK